ncbi:trimeric intracellular cation channel family protein [Roseivivax marinus]|uniref:trimeric intracellular cation channel family protein n=1 Tax=Roseivivax marinus TaxID=1379903 RepID=UPI001F03EF8C|nr:trimeric intracellular cation channel family protein [Roseivivax marinus]UMA64820.1 trimeric intracellular cation channel family protein [Roseivivax marinus]
MNLVPLLDYAAVTVFALTGALVASREQLDIVGFAFLACLTGMGGGSLRDILLDRPIFWIADPVYLIVATAAAVTVFFLAHRLESRWETLTWLDAAALSIAVAAGALIAAEDGQPLPVVVVMGMITGCVGGLARDVVSNEVPLLLRPGQLYVTCAFSGALSLALLHMVGVGAVPAAILCCATCFILRAGAIKRGWELPIYKPRPKSDDQ